MKNPRITPKEHGLIKGSLRRVFSRSELRRQALDKVAIEHTDERRPRVTRWAYCEVCGSVVPAYTLVVDHKVPVVPLDSFMREMAIDDIIDRLWCDPDNLQAICEVPCHLEKTKRERIERKKLRPPIPKHKRGK